MLHKNVPETPFFRDGKPTNPIQEIALRVLVELPGPQIFAIGTACLIGGFLALTARHVIEYPLKKFRAQKIERGFEVSGYSIKLVQVLAGPVYNIFEVERAWFTSSDIAILHLRLDGTSAPEQTISWRSPILRVLPPPSGEKVLAFGYRESKIEVTENADGGPHIDINDLGTTSGGIVGQIFPERRDSAMLTFPCFEVHAKFFPGMSGGLVVDEYGRLCGLVCAGLDFQDPNTPPLSYAATLWPLLTTIIAADVEGHPRGASYPVIDLALDQKIHAIGLEGLDPNLFPGRKLPRGD
jgi:Trypsin-like peptidase domain